MDSMVASRHEKLMSDAAAVVQRLEALEQRESRLEATWAAQKEASKQLTDAFVTKAQLNAQIDPLLKLVEDLQDGQDQRLPLGPESVAQMGALFDELQHGSMVNYALAVLDASIWKVGTRLAGVPWTTMSVAEHRHAAATGLHFEDEQGPENVIDGIGGEFLGHCWAMQHFPGSSLLDSAPLGWITIGFGEGTRLVVEAVFVEHSYAPISPNMASAVHKFRVWCASASTASQPTVEYYTIIDVKGGWGVLLSGDTSTRPTRTEYC